ncbi:hypothetical protein HK104_002630 [Borealophlyctis nickersoniae]|nr:hypothetical protein HK104_002630 [Borealophlyctis nickersoniae]
MGRDYVGAFSCQEDYQSEVYRVDEQSAVWYIRRKGIWEEWLLNLYDGSLNLEDESFLSSTLFNPTYRSPFLAREVIREDRGGRGGRCIPFSIVRFRDRHEICQVMGSYVKVCGNIFVVTTLIDSSSRAGSCDVWEIAPTHSTAAKKFSFDARCYDLNETMIGMVTMDGSLSLVRIADNHTLKVIEHHDLNVFRHSIPFIMTRTHLFSYNWQNDDLSVFDLKTLEQLYTLSIGEPEFPKNEPDGVISGLHYWPTDDGTMLFRHMDGRSILIDPKRNAPWILRPPVMARARASGRNGVYVLARDYSLQEDGKRTMASGETVVLWQEISAESDA